MNKFFPRFFYSLAIIIILSLVIVLTACSSGNGSSSTTNSSTPATSGTAINIANFAFSPATLTINTGTKVIWINNDGTAHTVTSDNGTFNSGNLAPNASFSFTFNSAGTFTYHCAIHSSMIGTIIVH